MMKKTTVAVLDTDSGATSSPPVASSSSRRDDALHSRASTLLTDAARSTRDTHSHSSSRSHDTVEKGGEQQDEERDSNTSYYDSYEEGEEEETDEEGSEAISSSSGGGGFPSPGSPPPQEDLLRFLSFTLEDAALKDHRLMTMEAFQQVLLLGTNQGAVAVVDATTGRLKDLFFNHREPISDVDCTVNELYVASSDKAGYVSVQSRRDTTDVWISQLGTPIESIALHPVYHKLDSRPMVCGGGAKVLLLTKGLLWSNIRRVTTLQEGRGRIYRVRWCQHAAIDVVAWLSDQEVTLYDMKNESLVHRVALPGDTPQNALYPPTLRWERSAKTTAGSGSCVSEGDGGGGGGGNSAVLLCGWGDIVQEIRLTSGSGGGGESSSAFRSAGKGATATGAEGAGTSSPAPPSTGLTSAVASTAAAAATAATARASACRGPYTVDLHTAQPLRPSRTAFPYRVCGIAPFGPQRYVVLASLVDPHAEGVMKDLEVRVVERASLRDVYRGRMPARFIHPLQLRLAYLDPLASSQSHTAVTSNAAAASSSPLDLFSPSPLTQYFILSVDTVVKAKPADVDDHVEFLLRTGQFEQAYTYAALHLRQLRWHVLQQVGHQWLLHLFETRATDSTAILKIIELLPELVPRYDSLAWEQWIYRLDTCGESWRLVALLPGRSAASAEHNFDHYRGFPRDDDDDGGGGAAGDPPASPEPAASPTLQVPIRREYYDLVLLRCLRHDANLFYAVLHKFDTLFSVPVVLKATEAAYREHCSSRAWWSAEEEEEETVEGKKEQDEAASDASPSSTSPSNEPAQSEEKGNNSNGTSAGVMNRTARWSLAASYGYLLRCAGRFEEAMQAFMHLPSSPRSDRELFGLIRGEQLFRKTLQMLPELLQQREDATLELLMEHVAPPLQQSSLLQFTPEEAAATATTTTAIAGASSSPLASPNSTAQPLLPSQFGSTEDPLNVEAVIDRLESSDRLHLLRYLDLVKEVYPRRFIDTAKRHAQLVATLYIDYDRTSLLPFLKQMSMYVERIRELHALCHKNNFVEEEIFLLFRMGREEEALRILIEKMHDIHRALEFIVSIPEREEQVTLFVRLVDYIVHYNSSLPCRRKRDDNENENEEDSYDAAVASGGIRYVLHQTQPGETYASIAQSYHVSVDDLRTANRVLTPGSCAGRGSQASPPRARSSPRGVYLLPDGNNGFPRALSARESASSPPPPPRCVVPLNLFGSLLNALADPQFSEHPALDVRLVLKKLPYDEPIPHGGASIAAIAHTVAEENGFLSTVSEVGERDLMGYYSQLLKRRTAAIVMGQSTGRAVAQDAKPALTPKANGSAAAGAASIAAVAATNASPTVTAAHRCAACHQLVAQQMVVFACQHMYHPGCVLQYMRESTHDTGGTTTATATTTTAGKASRDAAEGGTSAAREPTSTPDKTVEALRKLSVYCRLCQQHTAEQH